MGKNNVKETAYSTKVYPAMMGDYAKTGAKHVISVPNGEGK